ncbi:unnamed protein product [Vitrella brassicaformis CCMP3155]|uniref:Protein kinase domain-containing protein n=1 Tax=Vitrella brassicaformis (strain CCMP3155) TaxID=1169540 RepID=A0A0G4GIJ0_VITBC|nr:unnamed protein product [Vitrella brassicaformis CCMP3155]|eukprot:CEM29689.1 unnamed protein product [Vitrella brassicaformis CCMP3155]
MYQQNDDSDGWGIDESLIAVIMKDVCRALDGLHKKGLIHRDVKAANILVSNEGRAYLTDFGISKLFSPGETVYAVCGSPLWIAPEVLGEKGYNEKADIWSLGITTMELAKACSNGLVSLTGHYIRDFVEGCVRLDPSARASAEELCNHPFVKDAIESHRELLKELVDWYLAQQRATLHASQHPNTPSSLMSLITSPTQQPAQDLLPPTPTAHLTLSASSHNPWWISQLTSMLNTLSATMATTQQQTPQKSLLMSGNEWGENSRVKTAAAGRVPLGRGVIDEGERTGLFIHTNPRFNPHKQQPRLSPHRDTRPSSPNAKTRGGGGSMYPSMSPSTASPPLSTTACPASHSHDLPILLGREHLYSPSPRRSRVSCHAARVCHYAATRPCCFAYSSAVAPSSPTMSLSAARRLFQEDRIVDKTRDRLLATTTGSYLPSPSCCGAPLRETSRDVSPPFSPYPFELYFPLDEVVRERSESRLPPWVDHERRWEYLHPSDFVRLFGMGKERYRTLDRHTKSILIRRAGLACASAVRGLDAYV